MDVKFFKGSINKILTLSDRVVSLSLRDLDVKSLDVLKIQVVYLICV